MKRRTSQIIMGSTLGLAAIAAAIDHTRHPVPDPVETQQQNNETKIAPCSLEGSPCSLDAAPCGLGGASPCSLGLD